MSDPEKAKRRADGYDRLASLMGEVDDVAIFRRFGALSAEDLLYRQAELAELEEDLRHYQQEDKDAGDPERARYNLNWGKLRDSDGAQLQTILEIRTKLKDYQEALIRHRKVLELGTALPRQVEALSDYMNNPERGNIFLQGVERYTWENQDLRNDLVALAPPTPGRAFTSNFSLGLVQTYNKYFGRIIHKAEKKKFLRNTIVYSDSGAFLVIKTLATLLACLLPICGIVVLWKIERMEVRLGAVAGFTALFSVSLSLLTSASIQQIFASTATFAAVLVVFVGTTEIGEQK